MDFTEIDRDTIRAISHLVQNETGKRQFYRPIYSLHKWWARRAGAHFRSLILLASGKTDNLFKFGKGSIPTEESEYFSDYSLEELIIFDPFMGGGTTLVEANRMGAKVVGCDINPVSYWIVSQTLSHPKLEDMKTYFKKLEGYTLEKITSLYETNCQSCQNICQSLYTFWLRSIPCPACGLEVKLFKRIHLNRGKHRSKPVSKSNPATVFCPYCFELRQWSGEDEIICEVCKKPFPPDIWTYNRGKYQCLACGNEDNSLLDEIKNGQHLALEILAIEYWCPTCDDRLYKKPDESDLQNCKDIAKDFHNRRSTLFTPSQEIPSGTTSRRWRNHGFIRYDQVFNSRQIIAYNHIIEGLNDFPSDIRSAFLTILSNSLEYNNMMTPYNFPHRKLHHLFTHHALPLTTTPVEGNVWGVGRKGAGTFVNCYYRYLSAVEYAASPYDKFRVSTGTIVTLHSQEECINASIVDTFQELEDTPRGALILCGDSSSIPQIPDKSIDFIITDPPYYDNIHYSELSNFFYVWLQRLVNSEYFQEENVPIDREAVGNVRRNQGIDHYQEMLTKVFRECYRILKPAGFLVFTFHHKKLKAWWSLVEALRESRFEISYSFPTDSEYKVNPHIRAKDALSLDLNLFCVKRTDSLRKPYSVESYLQQFSRNLSIELDSDWNLMTYMGQILSDSTKSTANFEWFAKVIENLEKSIYR